MTSPKISVIVPVFNVEKYLEECLESIINQTLRDIEIICINDGSTDSSPDILARYSHRDPRIHVITKSNTGYGDSMNIGIEQASGQYISIVESDDFIDSTMLEDLYAIAMDTDADIVKSNFFIYYSDISSRSKQWDQSLGAVYSREFSQIITQKNTFAGMFSEEISGKLIRPTKEAAAILFQRPAIWAAIYKRRYLNENQIRFLASPGASYQDTGFHLKVMFTTKRMVTTTKAYLHYRQDNESSSIHSPGKVFCVADEFHEVESYLKGIKKYHKYATLLNRIKWGSYLWNFNRLTDGPDGEFLKLFSREFKQAKANGELDMTLFSDKLVLALEELIAHPKTFLKRKTCTERAKIAVVVAIDQPSHDTAACLESIRHQTEPDIAIIGTYDESHAMPHCLVDLYRRDARVSLYASQKSGRSSSINTGIARSPSELILFSDGTTKLPADLCARAINSMKTEIDITLIGHSLAFYIDSLFRLSHHASARYIVAHSADALNIVVRRSIIRKYGIWLANYVTTGYTPFLINYLMVSKNIATLFSPEPYKTTNDIVDIVDSYTRILDFAIVHQLVATRLPTLERLTAKWTRTRRNASLSSVIAAQKPALDEQLSIAYSHLQRSTAKPLFRRIAHKGKQLLRL